MKLDFDPKKDAANLHKHGLSLAAAAEMNLLNAAIVEDTRRDDGERRYRAFGAIRGRMHMLVFTFRGDTVRAISLRKANRTEETRHGSRRPEA